MHESNQDTLMNTRIDISRQVISLISDECKVHKVPAGEVPYTVVRMVSDLLTSAVMTVAADGHHVEMMSILNEYMMNRVQDFVNKKAK